MGGLGGSGFGGLGGSGFGGMSMEGMQELMQNPVIQGYMRQMMSDPQLMQQVSLCSFFVGALFLTDVFSVLDDDEQPHDARDDGEQPTSCTDALQSSIPEHADGSHCH